MTLPPSSPLACRPFSLCAAFAPLPTTFLPNTHAEPCRTLLLLIAVMLMRSSQPDARRPAPAGLLQSCPLTSQNPVPFALHPLPALILKLSLPPAHSGADPLLKNAEGRSAIDVAVANGYANLARLMRDTANQQAAKRREASSQHLDGLPRTSAQQQRGQHGMQPRVSGAFGYPEWNATSSMAQPHPGQQRFRGLPSEMMTLATQQGQQAQQAQPQARVSPLPEPQPRVSPQPVAVAVETAQAADGMPRPSPFDQEAGQAAAQAAALRATPPATPPRGSPGGVTPSTSSNNLAKQPTTAEAYLAQFREAASQGQGGSGEQRQASAGAASGLPSSRQLSAASSSGAGDAPEAVPPHLVRNAGGVPAWWLGPQPSLGPGQSPRHGRAISQPTIQEGVPLDGASVGNGGPAGHGPHAGEQQQQDFNTGSSSTSGGSRWGLLTWAQRACWLRGVWLIRGVLELAPESAASRCCCASGEVPAPELGRAPLFQGGLPRWPSPRLPCLPLLLPPPPTPSAAACC